ncbi:MAG: sigma-54-dependent Fis family transcriptional regulator [Gammaproteobacteria bacterium]|nr:sigma-54-dependent Fis family transcriptional regulator [Gammaproteobacteria bacterium]NIR99253.1 sigma-54-dependent Fis family transcriptional regulator [Gammaproteobacteria bacterium]NIT64874.1 sigma-54-dependent Fis family transcriptional regulator [Gammaproteobacteria bacterium]NIV21824.1 AAA domain-containing protein [Gammaproteobacteria bacterium]NIX10893.1 AAA domain-containing protein [Gammaproteobacteria bacterium]
MSAFDKLLGNSPELGSVTRAARIAATTEVTVLILGESGTGKELLAEAIHRESPRARRPFFTLNCATLPESLAESEIFGHRKGAFTGAVADQAGRIHSARSGTLFLDEVGELPPPVQAKLLRLLESGECQAVGQARPDRVDVRVLAATNRDLYAEVQAGRFRADLYYRLNVIPLSLPPLRQRGSDLVLLLERLTAQLARGHGLDAPRFSPDAMDALRRYRWPGNVRELRNFCERMVVLFSGKEIHAANLPAEIRCHGSDAAAGAGFTLPDGGLRLDELEANMIRQALVRAGGNRSKAARLLGLTRDTLLYRIKKYALTVS